MAKANELRLKGIVPIIPTPFSAKDEAVLPQIVFSLQHLEPFHHAEKRLLLARGILPEARVLELTLKLNEHTEDRIAFLNEQILAALDRLRLPRNPIPEAVRLQEN